MNLSVWSNLVGKPSFLGGQGPDILILYSFTHEITTSLWLKVHIDLSVLTALGTEEGRSVTRHFLLSIQLGSCLWIISTHIPLQRRLEMWSLVGCLWVLSLLKAESMSLGVRGEKLQRSQQSFPPCHLAFHPSLLSNCMSQNSHAERDSRNHYTRALEKDKHLFSSLAFWE